MSLAPLESRENPFREDVNASEIADWVYCPEQWRLAKTGHLPVNQPVLDAGKEHHADLTITETAAGGFIAVGRVLIILGILAALVAWLWR